MTTIYKPPPELESILFQMAELLAFHAHAKVEITIETSPDNSHTKVLDYRRYQKAAELGRNNDTKSTNELDQV